MILGHPVEFTRTTYQRVVPREKKILDLDEQHVIDTEIYKLLANGVIIPSSHEQGEYISPIFTRAKKDGSFRVILNLFIMRLFADLCTLWENNALEANQSAHYVEPYNNVIYCEVLLLRPHLF